MPVLTLEQIITLAPDPSSAKAARELATARKWLSPGQNGTAAWGEFQGSGKKPYQTCINLKETTFKCSCPSRKFPCKHALGLFLLLAAQPEIFSGKEPPDWVSEWLEKRSQRNEKAVFSAEKKKKNSSQTRARREQKREERVRLGLDDLELWLADLMRQGLNNVQTQPQAFWETPASRLVDAQAPGLARRLRGMAIIPGSGEGWQSRLLEQAAELYLLLESYRRLEDLPQPMQEDIRTQIGWTQKREELLQMDGIKDTWMVLGKNLTEERLGNLGRSSFIRIQRIWLLGKISRQPALILNFAAPGQVLETGPLSGTSLEAELVFFPAAFPLRALIKQQTKPAQADISFYGNNSLVQARKAYAAALGINPWLDIFPMCLQDMLPTRTGENWGVKDTEGYFFPFVREFSGAWRLLSLSGGNPLDLFCEWDGSALLPLSVWTDGRMVPLQNKLLGSEVDD